MADIDEIDQFSKELNLRRVKLEITRMEAAVEENEFKLLSMEQEKKRLKNSIDISAKSINEKKQEYEKLKKEYGM